MGSSKELNEGSGVQERSDSVIHTDEQGVSAEALLRERLRLDKELKEKFSREITVLFTDIKGSTAFFEKYGDLDGRQMVQQHNDLLFPLVEKHHGQVIKTIGDAIMASFDDPRDAVLSAINMQEELHRHNQEKTTKEKINIRIGLNTGIGIVEKSDVFGDVVNLASRVESQADAGEILVSEESYQKVRHHSDIICRMNKTVKVKGKEEEVKLYRVVWGEEELIVGKTRSKPLTNTGETGKELVLDLEGGKSEVKIGLSERTGKSESAVRQYVKKQVDENVLSKLCEEVAELLKKATKQSSASNEVLICLKKCGQDLMELLLTPSVIKQLKEELNGTSLLLRMNERLVHIPWELLYTGGGFLCLKFNMGRVVSTRQKVSSRGIRKLEMPLRMLIIANPTGDLESARSEGEELQQLGKNALEKISTVLLGKDASSQKLADEIGNFDLCHYAGHAVYDDTNPEKSRWLLNNDQLDAGAIGGLGGKRPLPALIFSNACSSGHSGQWVLHEDFNEHVFGMANAFLLSGTRHYIGTFRELVDGPGQVFSQQFYERLLAGASVGHALRLARQEIVDRYGEDSVIWASYLLYGAPSFVYFPQENVTRDREATKPATASDQLSDVTSAANEEKRPLLWGGAAIVIVLLLTIVYFLVSRSEAPPVVAPPQVVVVPAKPSVDMNEAVALYKKGAYEAAIPILQARLQEDASDRVAMAFLRESQQRLAIQSSEAEQHKIDDLAKQLIERHRAQPKGQGPTVSDEWTSRPLTVALLDLVHKGEAVLTTGKEEYIPIGLGNGLQEQGRIRLVDRALLAQVMRELQLGSSDLANPSTQLKIGRILAAKTFVAGSVLGMDQQVQVNLRIIDTETTEVLGQVSELFSKNDSIFDVVKRLADDMAVRILQAYPIRCRVASGSQDGQLELNAGSNIGLKTGMLLTDRNGHSEVEVVRVEGNRAYAKGESLAVDTMLQQKL